MFDIRRWTMDVGRWIQNNQNYLVYKDVYKLLTLGGFTKKQGSRLFLYPKLSQLFPSHLHRFICQFLSVKANFFTYSTALIKTTNYIN